MALCTVSGTIKTGSETAISGMSIKALPISAYFSTTIQIVPQEVTTTTDASGNWSLNLNQGGQFLITMFYPPNALDSARRASYSIIVPAAATADFSTLVTE